MKGKLLVSILLLSVLHAEEKEEPPKCGNFSLPTSQQPSALVSFGQNIVDQGVVCLFWYIDGYYGKHGYLNDIFPGILWGIRDDLSLFINFPFSPGNKEFHHHSAGLEDFSAQLEWAFYSKSTCCSFTQATLVANVTAPTGSATKNPPTGFGSPGFFFGTTLNYSTVTWEVFTSYGYTLTTQRHRTKIGNSFLYEIGLERYLPSPCGWTFAVLLELDGVYSWKDKIKGKIDRSSGGNVIYLTPSLWFSSERTIIQIGVGYPIVQHLIGKQAKKFVSYDINIGVTL